jgi:hypothetical protein
MVVAFLRKYEKYALAILLVYGLIFFSLSKYYGLDWRFAAGFSYTLFGLFVVWAFVKKDDHLFRQVVVFGIVAGFTELASDWWIVSEKGSLVYYPDEPMIVSSPLYMPFSWAVVFIQVGFLGWLLAGSKPLWRTVVVTSVIGLLFIPAFEHVAKDANWWYYQNCRMVASVPYYIIASEVAVSATLPLFFTLMQRRKGYLTPILFGIVQGLWIWLSCMLAYFALK